MYRLARYAILVVLLTGALLLPAPAMVGVAQEPETPDVEAEASPLDACRRGAWSSEEDFMMMKGTPVDGNPYISDGDLLSFAGQVCMRNSALVAPFFTGVTASDMGLDAVDILDFAQRVVAFSTELDHPQGRFTAGDLLSSLGAVIPNVALTAPFRFGYDVGLDGLQFLGETRNAINLLTEARNIGRDGYLRNPDQLLAQLRQWNVDIWFSIEGTHRSADGRLFLDGDILSARGTVVATNASLLPNTVPAGIPQRGVDFGVDAIATGRSMNLEESLAKLRFSTEILFRGQPAFTDGDVLAYGDGVVRKNEELVRPFEPAADFVGLDALWLPLEQPPSSQPNIQTMCGSRQVADFNGGIILPDESPGTGLHRTNYAVSPPGLPPRQPCGEYVPVDGYLPATGVKRFRVAYRPAANLTVPTIGTASGIRTNWTLNVWDSSVAACLPTGSLSTDSNGWMDAAAYLDAKAGGASTGYCGNSGMRLAVWDTKGYQAGYGPPDINGRYRLWLEWEDSGGVLRREPYDHTIQLDNKLPEIYDLRVTLENGTTPVNACGRAPQGSSIFKIWGRFADDYYWGYYLQVRGGRPPASAGFGWHNYYDGTPEVANTDDTGTTPDGNIVLLRSINMNALGASFVDCCYVLDLWVRDASIRYSFDGRFANDNTGSITWWANAFLTFAAAP